MKDLKYALLILVLAFFTACSKDSVSEQLPLVSMTIESKSLNGKVNEKLSLSAVNKTGMTYDERWTLNGELKSTTSTYDFVPSKSGMYEIEYTATNHAGQFSYKYTVDVSVPTVPSEPGSNMYVTTMFEFLPAPGQNTNKTLGIVDAAKSLEGKMGIVSLGAWGGYVVYGFDHTVINEPGKEDIIIYGNAQSNFAEPAVVWVMQDENGNGKPDDTWYELKGSEFGKAGYERNYEVTYTKPAVGGSVSWRDNKGNTGTVNIFSTSFQSFPLWLSATEYTLKGSVLPNTGLSGSGLVTSMPFGFGYADNTVGGDKVDIANAIDKDGKMVSLGGIDFVKIQTGVQANLGALGELSTELTGVADLSLVK